MDLPPCLSVPLLMKMASVNIRQIAKKTRHGSTFLLLRFLLRHSKLNGGRPPASLPTFAGRVTVTLTSYPPRFRYLHLTLQSLLRQSVRADRIVLWIAQDDAPLLPDAVRSLTAQGLEIRLGGDLRSFKKLIYAVEAFPDDFLAIADDDVFYPKKWLETLLLGYDPGKRVIPCRRAHRITVDPQGGVLPYRFWEWDIRDNGPCDRIVPTGVGGVLYPPNSLDPGVVRRDVFNALCPSSDDLWFYWMARRNQYTFRKVGGRFRMINWPETIENALFTDNFTANDIAVERLLQAFGPPFSAAVPA